MEKGRYIKIRKTQEKNSCIAGGVSSAVFIGVVLLMLACGGLKYQDPPPPEKEDILVEMLQEEIEVEKPKQRYDGTRPRAEEVSKEIKLVQQSEAQHIGEKSNEVEETTIGPDGDVEVPEPPREKEINKKALFAAADNKAKKDTLAAQTAREVTDALKAGHALGNTDEGETSGEPKATLKGRTHNGSLPRPSAPGNQVGKVVVEIWVDNYGVVQKAVAGAEGTTVNDSKLWKEAQNAAMKASFNMSADSPAMQKGTITYIFKIK